MLYDKVEIEAIKIAVADLENIGIGCKDTLIKSVFWLSEYYENTNEERYLEKAIWHIYAYLELGFPYENGERKFNKVLKHMGKSRVELFSNRKWNYRKVKLNKTSIRSMIGNWNPVLHSMKINDVVNDIIEKARNRECGEFIYHSGKMIVQNEEKQLWEQTYKLYIDESETIFHNINENKYFVLEGNKMIKVAVVDDDIDMQRMIQHYMNQEIRQEDNVEVVFYDKGSVLLEKLDGDCKVDILFLDIELPDINGIELGKRIREKYSRIYLVYLTSHSEFAIESYVLDAFQYILKEQMEVRLPQILRQLIKRVQKETKYYRMIGTNLDKEKVYYRDIITICKEKGAKYVKYNTVKGEYRERISLDEVLQNLHNDEFILVERGVVINAKHIAKLKNNDIYMDNKEKITISRTLLAKVRKQINLCWGANNGNGNSSICINRNIYL